MHKVLSQSIAAELSAVRSAPDSSGTQAAGGPALSTTAKVLSIPLGADWVSITPRNFVGCGVARVAITPRLTVVVTTDLLTTTGAPTAETAPTTITTQGTQNISDEMQDGDATDFAMDAFTTFALSAAVYVGARVPFRGAAVDVGTNVNANAKVLTVKYPNGGAAGAASWADISDSDGTQTGGNTTMAQDGDVTWTVPTTWQKRSLVDTGDTAVREPWSTAQLYWTRWEVNGALSADWDIRQIRALSSSTAYAELVEGQPLQFAVNTSKIANVEALTDAGTCNLVVNAGTLEAGMKEAFA